MKIKLLFLLIILLCPFQLWAQTASTDSLKITERGHSFRPSQLILPASLITVGALGVANPWLKSLNREVRDDIAGWRNGRYFHADDYIQYVPVIANFGLSLLGAKAKHSYVDRVLITTTSYAAMGIMVNAVKWAVDEQRPDGTAFNSFPSGHTATVFMGAELVRMEYKDSSPLYGIGAYTIACGVAFLRLYNERHWCNDVLAGAGIGILSARIGYWLLPFEKKLFGLDKKKSRVNLAASPYYNHFSKEYGGMIVVHF
ncbi:MULTISPECIES: phosphatase PAP2 family protein [Bacteroides]|uniref:phosphatase PAP2 family protein n=1 Tax=Bacteroides TaxID=816 RepID=UPI00259CE8D5|nr:MULTISPECIES: phosphatase PAP2 family protein [Bacteroides]